MNIKKLHILVLCIALSLGLSFSVYAEVNLDDYAYFADDGSLKHDMDAYHYALAKDLVSHSGVDIDPSVYWLRDPYTGEYAGYDYASFRADYDTAIAALAPDPAEPTVSEPFVEDPSVSDVEESVTDEPSLDEPEVSLLDTVLEDTVSDVEEEVVEDIPHQYVVNDLREPVGSGTLFFDYSNSEILGTEKNGYYVLVSTVCPSHDDMMRATCTSVMQDGDVIVQSIPDIVEQFGSGFTEDYIDGTLFFVVYNAPLDIYVPRLSVECVFPVNGIYVVEHGFNNWLFHFQSMTLDIPDFYGFPLKEGVTLNGTLKNLVISIFGAYEPVNTTALLTETVDNVTTTTLIDVVASGAAGVDWEWCAGVFLFGIMLFCLFKLLGGILS